MIKMSHQIHGDKFALSEMEALNDEKEGWMRSSMIQQSPAPQEKIDVQIEESEECEDKEQSGQVQATIKRRGRPPKIP